ncbi:MAG: glycosyltransferase, partial [Acidothermales bacterium]|nr:glycosyltransferase [Acidothermales bacterium]
LDLAGVVELAGPLSQARVRELIGGSAVLAAPSVVGRDGNQDGLPTVLLEAMALGTPCVSTPVTGIPEVLQDGLTGLLVPQHDPPALAAALGRLIDDATLRVRLACAARARVEREFASDRQARQLAGLLEVDARHGDIVAGSAVAGSEVA